MGLKMKFVKIVEDLANLEYQVGICVDNSSILGVCASTLDQLRGGLCVVLL